MHINERKKYIWLVHLLVLFFNNPCNSPIQTLHLRWGAKMCDIHTIFRVPVHTSIRIKHPISQQLNRFTYQILKLDCNPFIIENVNHWSKTKNWTLCKSKWHFVISRMERPNNMHYSNQLSWDRHGPGSKAQQMRRFRRQCKRKSTCITFTKSRDQRQTVWFINYTS